MPSSGTGKWLVEVVFPFSPNLFLIWSLQSNLCVFCYLCMMFTLGFQRNEKTH